jgi:hypothetical protein
MKNYLTSLFFATLFVTSSLNADVTLSEAKFKEIESRVQTMDISQLNQRNAELLSEKNELEEQQETTQSPAQNKSIQNRLAEIIAELDAIQKAFASLAALGLLNNLTDDGYNDNVPPVITVLGNNPASVELGDSYSDAGATANDDFHGVTSVITSGTVDTSSVGTYTLTYTATDLDNNTATATRTVNVVDTTAPVITITDYDNPTVHELGTEYIDAGATATDASGPVTVVVVSSSVDTTAVGVYAVNYSSTDASGNVATDTRMVEVVDTTVPVFTSSSTFIVDEGVTDIGSVTATDLQAITFTISGSDIAITAAGVLTFVTPADYEAQTSNPITLPYDNSTYDITATVTATDASSNTATQVITVSIRDVGGIDDNVATGTGTSTNTSGDEETEEETEEETGTATGTGTTGTGTGTGTGTTGTGTGTGTGT